MGLNEVGLLHPSVGLGGMLGFLLMAPGKILPHLVSGWDSTQTAPGVVPNMGLLNWLHPSFAA